MAAQDVPVPVIHLVLNLVPVSSRPHKSVSTSLCKKIKYSVVIVVAVASVIFKPDILV